MGGGSERPAAHTQQTLTEVPPPPPDPETRVVNSDIQVIFY